MKILLVANTAWYLYNFRLSLAEALRREGVDVLLVSPLDKYKDKLVAKGFQHISYNAQRGGLNPLTDLSILAALIKIYRKEQPDLIHHFTSKCVVYGSLAAKFTGTQKIINSITGLGYVFTENGNIQKILKKIIRVYYQWSLKGTHVIFQNSDDAKELFLFGELGVKSSRVIQSSGVDLKRFRPIEKPRGTPIIVLAARMLRHKGVIEFVEAAKIIHSNGIDARMVLVGEPDPQNPSSIPAPQLKAWHDSRMVEWWGWQEDIESVYAQASIVCLPSYREGLPKSLIEATACGLPIVATDSNGCRDVVIDGVNGFLVPIGDAVKLANALLILINDSSLRQKMGNKGRELAEIHFDTTRINNETFLIYDLKAQ